MMKFDARYHRIIQGKIYKCQLRNVENSMYSYWMAPIDPRDSYHLEDMLMNIATGEIKHFAHFDIVSCGDFEEYFN